jgi:hypothetical protein
MELFILKKEYTEGKQAKEAFEKTMERLFKAPKPQKHVPKKREKKGKD